MKEFDYEIKIENSPLNVRINLNGLKVKSMGLPSTPKVNDFNISFKDKLNWYINPLIVESASRPNTNTSFSSYLFIIYLSLHYILTMYSFLIIYFKACNFQTIHYVDSHIMHIIVPFQLY